MQRRPTLSGAEHTNPAKGCESRAHGRSACSWRCLWSTLSMLGIAGLLIYEQRSSIADPVVAVGAAARREPDVKHAEQVEALLDTFEHIEGPPSSTPELVAAEGTVRNNVFLSASDVTQANTTMCPAGNRTDGIFICKDGHSGKNRTTPDRFFRRVLDAEWLGPMLPRVLSSDPWIVTLDAFLTPEECDNVVKDCGSFKADITATGRVSSNRNSTSFNCHHGGECWHRSGISHYLKKLAAVTGVSHRHFEGLSVLKYLPGGFYKRHHDTLNRPTVGPQCYDSTGPRVLTFMTYLTDLEEDSGGATRFPELDIDVHPKAGRLLLWQDTKKQSPLWPDKRTDHEAMLVRSGVKITATSWINQYDRVASVSNGCCKRR